MVLIYDKSKVYIDKTRFVRDITSRKYNYLFDVIALIKNNNRFCKSKKQDITINL